MSDELLKRAQGMLSLQDVYIRDARAYADPEFEPGLSFPTLNVQFKLNASHPAEHLLVESDKGRIAVLRYLIEAGVRLLKPGVDPNNESISREQLLGEITAMFVVKYIVTQGEQPPAEELVSAFTDNAVYHMWPYWREFVHASTARLRLPAVVLPMRKIEKRVENPSSGKSN